MSQEVVLDHYGYRLEKTFSLAGATLELKTTLTNLGAERFRTPHYCHNFLTVDGVRVGRDYALRLPLASARYDDASSEGTWATPLDRVAAVSEGASQVFVNFVARLGASDRVKVAFARDDGAVASYVAAFDAKGPPSSSSSPRSPRSPSPASPRRRDEHLWVATSRDGPRPLYAFNLYVEATTLSPEPISLVDLDPGASLAWQERWALGRGREPFVGKLVPAESFGSSVFVVVAAATACALFVLAYLFCCLISNGPPKRWSPGGTTRRLGPGNSPAANFAATSPQLSPPGSTP